MGDVRDGSEASIVVDGTPSTVDSAAAPPEELIGRPQMNLGNMMDEAADEGCGRSQAFRPNQAQFI